MSPRLVGPCVPKSVAGRRYSAIRTAAPSVNSGTAFYDRARFELQPIFRAAVLIIVDSEEWQGKGVVPVRTGDSTGLELGLVSFAPLHSDYHDEGK